MSKITVKEYLDSLNVDLNGRVYIKKCCQVLRGDAGQKCQVLAACKTFYSAIFVFVRAKRVTAFTVTTPFYMSSWNGMPGAAGLGALRTGQAYAEINRIKANTPQKVENMLKFIQEVIDSPHGEGFIVDDIDTKMNPETRKVSKKTFLGEVCREAWVINYGYNSGRTSRIPSKRQNGDPMPLKMTHPDVRRNKQYYGYFLCKNGNIICYSRGGYYSSNSMSPDKTGDEYAQGPGNMIHPSEAMAWYKACDEDRIIAKQSTTYSDEVFKMKRLFEMEPKHMEQFQTQVLVRNLDDSSQGKPGAYYCGGRIYDLFEDTYIPEQ
jgi:hypothetical protein